MLAPTFSALSFIASIGIWTAITAAPCFAEKGESGAMTWRPGKIGAGGFVTGLDIHPSGDPMLARTDVGGGYRFDKASKTWVQLATTERLPADSIGFYQYHGVSSLVSAPSDPKRLYMAFNGQLFASDDKGSTWRKGLTGDLDRLAMFPNSESRMQGERLTVDPSNKDIAFFGSNQDGLWITTDGGVNWNRVSSVPEGQRKTRDDGQQTDGVGIGTVRFDPSSKAVGGRTQKILATVWGDGIFESLDGGNSWQRTGATEQIDQVEDAVFAKDGTYFVCETKKQKAWRYRDGQWDDISPKHGKDWVAIAVKPDDSEMIFLFEGGVMNWENQRMTVDGGTNWKPLGHSELVAEDVPWLVHEEYFSTGGVYYDPNQDRLWIAQGVGVWFCDNFMDGSGKLTWTSMSAGIEEMVVNDIVVPEAGKPLIACWDRAVFKIEQVDAFPATYGPTVKFNSGWDLALMDGRPASVVGIFQTQAENPQIGVKLSGYSDDGGRTWTPFEMLGFPFDIQNKNAYVFGNIAVSSLNPDVIIWQTDGEKGRFLHTKDRGRTWQDSKFEDGPQPGTWNGPNFFRKQILVADPVDGNTFYAYNWTYGDKGLYVSRDGGATFSRAGKVPGKFDFHCRLRARPGVSGHLFFTTGFNNNNGSDKDMGPLYESKDGGETWTEVPGTLRVLDVTFGAPALGKTAPTYYTLGTVATEAGDEQGIFMSSDEGRTWNKISEIYPMGVSAWVGGFAADPWIFGRLYLGTKGNGYFVGDIKK